MSAKRENEIDPIVVQWAALIFALRAQCERDARDPTEWGTAAVSHKNKQLKNAYKQSVLPVGVFQIRNTNNGRM